MNSPSIDQRSAVVEQLVNAESQGKFKVQKAIVESRDYARVAREEAKKEIEAYVAQETGKIELLKQQNKEQLERIEGCLNSRVQEENKAIETEALKNMDKAVDFLVSAVLSIDE